MSTINRVSPVTSLRTLRGAKVIEMNKARCMALSFLIECGAKYYEDKSAFLISEEWHKLAAEWRLIAAERA